MNGSAEPGVTASSKQQPRRIVLCFDGTGNKFQGDESDTNIVKIYQMLSRNTPEQYHYYQPGIGTYTVGQAPSSAGVFKILPKIRDNVKMTIDQALGSSFVEHVTSGYNFVMRYFAPGDHIYIFGFSRGAYTARFLAEMIKNIGLLSKGNEEMVQFAWQTFSAFQQSRGDDPETDKAKKNEDYMKDFRKTFCRPNVEIHFLGLFDCVNSVGQFEIPLFRHSYKYMAQPAATHIRHAVSIHERRLKFKPALFHLEKNDNATVDLKEVWFAGNHGDVGGGWPQDEHQNHLLSNTPLDWMVQEVLNLPGSESKLTFTTTDVSKRRQAENAFPEPFITKPSAAWEMRKKYNQPHDPLKFGGGCSWYMTMLWWVIEVLPIFTRLELENGKWVPRYFPPNLGAPRDIPEDAVIHHSVDDMIQAGILRPDQIQAKGGNNSHFPDVQVFHSAFMRLKKKKAMAKAKQADDRTPLLNNQNGSHA